MLRPLIDPRPTRREENEEPRARLPSIPEEARERGTSIEVVAMERRLNDRLDARFAGMIEGMESFVRVAVRDAVDEQLTQLRKNYEAILERLDEMKSDAQGYRASREKKEQGQQQDLMQVLTAAKAFATLEDKREKRKDERTDSTRKFRIALISALGGLLLVIATLVGVLMGRQSMPAPQLPQLQAPLTH